MPFCINAGLALWCLEPVTERSVPCHFASMQDSMQDYYGVWNRLQKEVFHVILHQCKTCTLELLLDFLIVKTYLFASLDYLLYNSWDDILYVGHCTLNRSKSHHRIWETPIFAKSPRHLCRFGPSAEGDFSRYARSCFLRGLTSLELSDLERSLRGQEFDEMRFSSWHSF